MSALKQRLLTNWHLMRIFRLGIGIWMVIEAITRMDILIGLFGLFFLYQAVANAGCCGVGGCYMPPYTDTMKKEQLKTSNDEHHT